MKSFKVTFQPSNTSIQCQADQTIAQAAEQQGVDIFIGCDNGVCTICQSERISGTFQFRNTLGQELLTSEDRVLCCIAKPTSDAELYMPSVHHADYKEARNYACQIASMTQIAEQMWHVQLLLPAGKTADFWPGQHLLLEIKDANGIIEQVPYSIGSAPASIMGGDPRKIDLYIASSGEKAQCVICFLRAAVVVRLTLPMGDCIINQRFLDNHPNQPLIMVAAGSGFSQIKCLTEAALMLNPKQEIHLYWSAREQSEFYLTEQIEQWAKQHPNFRYHLLLEEAKAEWTGRSGWIYQVLKEDFANFSQHQMFVCGSPNMVYGTLDQLAGLGLNEQNMHSDVFTYAPRN